MRKTTPAAAAVLALAAACGESKPLPPRPAPAGAAAAKPIIPAITEEPREAPQAIYVYTPIGKRDPFENVFAVREMTKVKVPGRKPTPLQKWGIDRLKLAMTMTGTSTPFAMIEDPVSRCCQATGLPCTSSPADIRSSQ